jgi:hypothetical protein
VITAGKKAKLGFFPVSTLGKLSKRPDGADWRKWATAMNLRWKKILMTPCTVCSLGYKTLQYLDRVFEQHLFPHSERKKKMSPPNDTLTTSNGTPVTDNAASLTVGANGPVLLQDFHLIDKLAHFDRERIPERVVHG